MVAFRFNVLFGLLAVVSAAVIEERAPTSSHKASSTSKAAASASASPLARIIRQCTKPKTVALTFDDGPYIYAQNISKAITAAGGKATFFVNGGNYACIYDNKGQRIKDLYKAGHQIANHSWRHDNLTTLTKAEVYTQMETVDVALQRIIGVTPTFMRPPYGAYNTIVREVVAARKQHIVLWDFDSGDSSGIPELESELRYTTAVSKNPANILTLNHDPIKTTADKLVPFAIKLLKSKGYKMVTVAECLGMEPYIKKVTPPAWDATKFKC